MNKTIGYVALSACSLILASFTVLQQFVIQEQKDTFKAQNITLGEVKTSLSHVQIDYDMLLEDYKQLEDSLVLYKDKVSELELIVGTLEANIAQLSGKAQRREKKFLKLEEKIAWLEKDGVNNEARILELEAEKTKLLEQMQIIEAERDKKESLLNDLEEQRMQAEIEKTKLDLIQKIGKQTWVNFEEISLRKKMHRGELDYIAPGEDKWKYTILRFNMNHADPALLLDKHFIIKLVDSDTGQLIPFLESNPQFPDSDVNLTGVAFTFEDNPVEVMHINTQEKSGQNYEVRIYYLADNGEEHLLQNSIRPIIQHGKPFSL